MTLTTDLGADVQLNVDGTGKVVAVVVPLALWQRLIDSLEDSEDVALARTLREQLLLGPAVAGALRWDDVADEWR